MSKQRISNKSSEPKPSLPTFLIKRLSEGSMILIIALALFVLLALTTYDVSDPSWLHITKSNEASNAGGQVGAYIADALYCLFGYVAFLLPLALVYLGALIFKDYHALRNISKPVMLLRGSGLIFMLLGGCALLSIDSPATLYIKYSSGGLLGSFVGGGFVYALNRQGTVLLLGAICLIGITLFSGLSWLQVLEWIGIGTCHIINWIGQRIYQCADAIKIGIKKLQLWRKKRIPKPSLDLPKIAIINKLFGETKNSLTLAKPRLEASHLLPSVLPPAPITLQSLEEELPKKPKFRPKPTTRVAGNLPTIELLDQSIPDKTMGSYTAQELETLSREVEQHLLDFGIQADVVAVHPGPVITRFELQLAAGIKVSKLSSLVKDLARSLSVISVRVVEVIPGKTVVGLELPNQQRNVVRLSEVLNTEVYQQAHSPLALALGVDIAGHPVIVDLAKMPHLLVAGTTGSGKSVGVNAMILSILLKSTPEQVRLIMIDPKMLELSVYDGIPHLLTPVVTDMKEAASALRWCVGEMEQRYRLMASLGVRNLVGFNAKISEANARGEALFNPLTKALHTAESGQALQPLPYIVVIIDELADMMMVVGKKVEQLIARIAQKARAAGIHLILATQRPSVDVLTGLIKSNIPTRISFQVSSKIDSRTILDQQGAEQLLGNGDLLYLPPGSGSPLRVHGAFVGDQEIHRIAEAWCELGEPEYIDEITQTSEMNENNFDEPNNTEEADPLYHQAMEFVIHTRKASTSSVQRRFKIGYNRAARLIEEMERAGIVGPLDGSFRDVLVAAKETEN